MQCLFVFVYNVCVHSVCICSVYVCERERDRVYSEGMICFLDPHNFIHSVCPPLSEKEDRKGGLNSLETIKVAVSFCCK